MRTDRTALCVSCRIRFSPVARCPACDRDRTTFDLRRSGASDEALAAFGRRARAPAGRTWIGLDTARLHTATARRGAALTALTLLLVFASPWLAAEAWGVSPALTVAVAVALVFLWIVGRAARAALLAAALPESPLQLQILERGPLAPDARRVRVSGVVRAVSRLSSPVGDVPCVAYRLVGETFGGVVDDACAVTFELLPRGEGDPILVELGSDGRGGADVDIPVHGVAREVASNGALRRFLSQRGLFPELGRLSLAEGLLREGDRVEVEGVAEEEPLLAGYREVGVVRVMRERPGAPLCIRRR